MGIIPLGDRVLLEPDKEETRTAGGLYIPESAQEKRKQGTVVAAGTSEDGKPLPLQAGDRVIYGGYSNEDITYEGKDYVLCEFKNVLAKLE